eukprot:Tamp_10928.p1 GENE.Tamp_10928~~Tamp_10928.p1  ORF type:complete len:637 (+),score=131.21 Tamp_10928:35-1912(+)
MEEPGEAAVAAARLLQAVLRTCITTTITIAPPRPAPPPAAAEAGLASVCTDAGGAEGPPASADAGETRDGGEGADAVPTGEAAAAEGGPEGEATEAEQETEKPEGAVQPGDPGASDAAPTGDGTLAAGGVPACAAPSAPQTEQGEAAATPAGPAALRLRWPRRLGSAFRVSVACARRLQGVLRRRAPREAYVQRSGSVLNLVQFCVRRAVIERKFRYALRRDALQVDISAVVRRRLFLNEDEMDFIDKATYAEYLDMFRNVEAQYQQLRVHQKNLAATEAEYKALAEYEDTLYNDLTRGGGGGLVRKLGGQRAAKKVLLDTQASLEDMDKTRRKHKEAVQRVQKDIKWSYEGNWDSLVSTEEFVQDGHLRCCAGEYVTIADRYKENPRFSALCNDIGKLTKRHSEGAWFVTFELSGCKQGFAAGGEGIFHLKYATNGEMQKTVHTVQQMNKDKRLAEEAAARAAALITNATRGPSSLTYNRNPVMCYYNLPVTEFANYGDLRYAARVVNHAACQDPRDRLLSKVLANAITASCWGKDPLTYTWHPKPPATYPPLGLSIDERTGTVTGTPHFLGDVTVYVKCTDADGYSSSTELRFYCERMPESAVMPDAPRIDNRSKRIQGFEDV